MPEIKLPQGLKLNNGKLQTILRCALMPSVPEKIKLDLALNAESLDELKPSASDYLKAQFRALSAAYLGPGGYFLDFSKPGVLAASLPLMLPREKGGSRRRYLMLHRNHSNLVQDRVGFIANATWVEAGGEQSAPGINIDTMLDWKLAPNEARQLISDPPLLDSVSVSVEFDWEKSHPDMRDWQFWDLLGHEVDGQMVRIVVTEITDYYHVALVWEGADEEADLILTKNQNGKNREPLAPADKERNHAGGMMKDLTISSALARQLCSLLGIEDLEKDVLASVTALAEANEELLAKQVPLEEKAKELQRVMDLRRAQVKALITKVDGECKKSFETVLSLMKWEDLEEIAADYQAKLEEKFPLTCGKCGSKHLSGRSSKEEDVNQPHSNGKAEHIDPAQYRVA